MIKFRKHDISAFLFTVTITLICFIISSLNLLAGLTSIIIVSGIFLFSRKWKLFVLFFILVVIFQNAFIAYSSSIIENKAEFNILHGLNFFIISLYFVYGTLRYKTHRMIFMVNMMSLLLLTIFTGFGAYLYGFTNAIIYFRLFSVPFLMLSVGCFFSSVVSQDYLRKILSITLILILACSFLQFIFPKSLTIILNDVAYFGHKRGAASVQAVVNSLGSNSYFNIPWSIKLIRAAGLIKSSISAAYLIVVLSIYLYWGKSSSKVLFSILIMVVVLASKGALILFLLFAIVDYFRKTFSYSVAIASLCIIWGLAVFFGVKIGNEHIIGFVAGIDYLSSIGNGIGFSGNLSEVRLVSWAGKSLPEIGYMTRFQNGSESAWGVCMSSMGLFSLVYFSLYVIVARYHILRHNMTAQSKTITILLLLGIAQGIFQEEAFSPYSLGLIMLLLGFDIGISEIKKSKIKKSVIKHY